MSGVAAVGAPIEGGKINLICSSGDALRTQTNTAGVWHLTPSKQAFPGVVQVTGGTIQGGVNTIPYHSVASSAGNINISPLTDLMVANLTGAANPSIWFSGLRNDRAGLSQITQAKIDGSLVKLRESLNSLLFVRAIDPVSTPFSAIPEDPMDDVLAAMKSALKRKGITYANLRSAFANRNVLLPTGFDAALSLAYSGTASGGGVAAPAEPEGVSARAVSATQIKVDWARVSGAKEYRIYRSISPNVQLTPGNRVNSPALQSGPYVDTNRPPLSTFYYKVTAVNAAGESYGSSEVSVITPAPSEITYTDNLTLDKGGFVDIPLHSVGTGQLSLNYNPAPANGTLSLSADALSVRFQSDGIMVGEEQFTFVVQRQFQTVEVHHVTLMVRRTDALPNILFILTDDQNVGMDQALPWASANVRESPPKH